MIDLADQKQRVIDLTLEAVTRFKNTWLAASTRDVFQAAAAKEQSLKDAQRKEFIRKAHSISLEYLEAFTGKVNEVGVPLAGVAMEELQAAADAGEGSAGVWNMISARRISETFFFPDLNLQEDRHGIELSIGTGKDMVRYLKSVQPAFWEKLQELFLLCEKNNMAIEFRFPQNCDGEKVGGPGYVTRLPAMPQAEVKFAKMTIIVSPFDAHYRPLTVARRESIPEAGDTPFQKENRLRDYDFNHWMRTALNPDYSLYRLVTGRTYQP